MKIKLHALLFCLFLYNQTLQSQTIDLTFAGNGKLIKAAGIEQEYRSTNTFTLTVTVKEDKAFLREQFNPLLQKYLKAINNLKEEGNKKLLNDYYGITDSETTQIINDYYSKVYHINLLCGYYTDIKDVFTDFDKATHIIKKDETLFKNLYTFILNDASVLPTADKVYFDTTFTISSIPTYELRFNKPMARLTHELYSDVVKTFPNTKDHKDMRLRMDTLKQFIDTTNKSISIFSKKLLISKTKADSTKVSLSLDSLCKITQSRINNLYSKDKWSYRYIKTYIKNREEWIKLWLWYTDGIPKFNPFTVPSPAKTSNGESEDDLQVELAGYKKKMQYFDSVLPRFAIQHSDVILFQLADSIARAQKRIKQTEHQIAALAAANVVLPVAAQPEHANKKDLFLYEGKLTLSNFKCQQVVYYRHHDVENNFLPMYKLSDNYDERKQVIVVVENESIPIKVTNSDKLIEETTITSSTLGPPLHAMIDAIGNLKKDASLTCTFDGFKKMVADYNYFNTELAFPQTYTLFRSPSTVSLRRTFMKEQVKMDTNKTSYIRTYKLTTAKDTNIFAYRINKLYRFWPAAGFVYSYAKDPEVNINEDGSLSSKYFNGMHVIAGLKIHPWKTSVMDPDFIWSNERRPIFDYRKLYGFVGVDVTSAAKQYFVGGGIDLWSGLSLTGGSHIIRKQQEKYVNGKVEKKEYLDAKNLYVGVNIDITLAVKLVQFIFVK